MHSTYLSYPLGSHQRLNSNDKTKSVILKQINRKTHQCNLYILFKYTIYVLCLDKKNRYQIPKIYRLLYFILQFWMKWIIFCLCYQCTWIIYNNLISYTHIIWFNGFYLFFLIEFISNTHYSRNNNYNAAKCKSKFQTRYSH